MENYAPLDINEIGNREVCRRNVKNSVPLDIRIKN